MSRPFNLMTNDRKQLLQANISEACLDRCPHAGLIA